MVITVSEVRKTMIVVFAGANGSGKSTITEQVEKVGDYINADNIKKALNCTDLDAAKIATDMRNKCLAEHRDFTFETVLSTPRNLELLKLARENDYFIKCYYVLTDSPDINVVRVVHRVKNGGHSVPEDKIRARYERTLALVPELIPVCDICNIYDNTEEAFRIFSKKLETYRLWENEYWDKDRIIALTHQEEYTQMFLKSSSHDGERKPPEKKHHKQQNSKFDYADE